MGDDAHQNKLPELVPNIQTTSISGEIQLTTQVIDGELVAEAPIKVVPPGTLSTGGGAAIQGDVNIDRDFTGRDAIQNDVRYSSAGSSVNFLNPDNAALWQASMALLQNINDVAGRLDNIPGRLEKLEQSLHATPLTVPVTVPVKAEINVQLQSWLLIILIGMLVLAGGILIGTRM